MPGSRGRFINEYQSGHQRIRDGTDYEKFPRDAVTDGHLAEADLNSQWKWLEAEWGWTHELAEAIFHMNPTVLDAQKHSRPRVDTYDNRHPDFWHQAAVWDENLRKLSEGFRPSCSGPNAMLTLHVVCVAIGYIPILNAVITGAPGSGDQIDNERGALLLENGKPTCIKSRKLATESSLWGHRIGFVSKLMGFDLTESIDKWPHWQYRVSGRKDGWSSNPTTAPTRIIDIIPANFDKCSRPKECTGLVLNPSDPRQRWWRPTPIKWPLQQPRPFFRHPHEAIGDPPIQPDFRHRAAPEPNQAAEPAQRGRSPRSPRMERENKRKDLIQARELLQRVRRTEGGQTESWTPELFIQRFAELEYESRIDALDILLQLDNPTIDTSTR